MFFCFLLLLWFEISSRSKFFDWWPWKLQKWPWFLADVAVNACQDLATLWELWSPSVYTIQLKRVLAFDKTKWRLSVVSECCWELRCCPRQPPPVTEPWLHTDCWRGFKPLVPSDKRFNHSKVWCTFISSSTVHLQCMRYRYATAFVWTLTYQRWLCYWFTY